MEIPAFNPRVLEKAQNATHYRFLAGRASIPVGDKNSKSVYVDSCWLPVDNNEGVVLELPLQKAAHAHTMMVLGVEFSMKINREYVKLHTNEAAAIVSVVPAKMGAVGALKKMPGVIQLGVCAPCGVPAKVVAEEPPVEPSPVPEEAPAPSPVVEETPAQETP